MELNEYGQIAYNEWLKLTERFSNFEMDVFQIMPNHMHSIIVLNDRLANKQSDNIGQSPIQGQPTAIGQSQIPGEPLIPGQTPGIAPTGNATVGRIVGAYKSLVANACLEIFKIKNETMGKLWQRNYYEHIIRDKQAYHTISNYIINNPAKWNDDKFFKS